MSDDLLHRLASAIAAGDTWDRCLYIVDDYARVYAADQLRKAAARCGSDPVAVRLQLLDTADDLVAFRE
jgi:hypothetical protein